MIRTIYSKADTLKFYYKVSSEAGYDIFYFKLNGTEMLVKSGEIPWTQCVIAVPAGLNKMEWVYTKDSSVSKGSDCAWIDMIDFTGSGSVRYIQKDLDVARIVTPIQKDRFGQGTVTAKVLNLGKDTLNGFNLAYGVNDYLPVRQHFENTVVPYGDSVSVSFQTKEDMSKLGYYDFVVYGYDNNDDYLLNDTMSVDIKNTDILDSLVIYPNPFTDKFTVFINSPVTDKLLISITNVSGVKLYNLEKDILIGKNSINFADLRLLPGIYYLNIRGVIINKSIPVVKINK